MNNMIQARRPDIVLVKKMDKECIIKSVVILSLQTLDLGKRKRKEMDMEDKGGTNRDWNSGNGYKEALSIFGRSEED